MFGISYIAPLSHDPKAPIDKPPLPLPQLLIVSQNPRRVSENPSNMLRIPRPISLEGVVAGGVVGVVDPPLGTLGVVG